MKKLSLVAFVLVLPFIASGCASITQGTSQTLSFKLEPKEAKCVLSRTGDGELGSISASSNTILVHKGRGDIIVQCSAPGYLQKTSRVVSGASTAGVTGVLLDFGITDMITGAMYAYPTDMTIVMEKELLATPAPLDTLSGTPTNESSSQKLRDLQALRSDGVITEDDYQNKKQQLLR